MADATAVRAGQAFVELFADDSKLVRGLKGAERKLKNWGSSVTAVGSTIFAAGLAAKGALSAMTGIFEEVGASLSHMSERTGISVESLSQLSYAAGQSGVDMETFEGGVRKMQKTVGQASIGNKEAADSLARIGLSAQDLINLSPEQQFKKIADTLRGISNPAQRAAATMGIFGKQGTMLLPMLMEGSAGINALMEQADKLGLTMSSQDAAAARELHGVMTTVWATLKGVSIAIGSALAPSLMDLAKRTVDVIANVIRFIKENRGLIVTVSTIATAVVAAGAALVVAGMIISNIGVVCGVLASVLAGIASLIVGAFGAVGAVFGFMLSPIGILVATVAVLAVVFLQLFDVVQNLSAYFSEAFAGMAADFKLAFDAIKAALGSGDFAAAAKVLWAVLILEWEKGKAALNDIWASAKTFFLDTWSAAVYSVADMMISSWAGLQSAWIGVVDSMKDAWVGLFGSMIDIAVRALTEIAVAGAKAGAAFAGGDIVKNMRDAEQTTRLGMGALGGTLKAEIDATSADWDAKSKAQLDKIAQAKADRLAASKDALAKEMGAHAPGDDGGVAAARAAVAKARAEYDAAVAEANGAKKRNGLKKPEEASKNAIEAAHVNSSAGTFGATALWGLRGEGTGGQLVKIAQNTARTANLSQQQLTWLKEHPGRVPAWAP
jgi:hypothetical protein